MRVAQLLAPKRLTGSIVVSSCLRSSVLYPRTFATISASPSYRTRTHRPNQQYTRIQIQNACLTRSYWWSSKPTTPAAGSSEGALSSSASDGDVVAALSSIQEGSTLTHPSTDLGGQLKPSASHADQVSSASSASSLQEHAVLISNPTSDLASSLPTSELSSTIPTNDALGSLEALQAATTEFSALASLDYSHLFSWVWAPGAFLRAFAFLQEIPILSTSPIACMVLGVLAFRLPLSYFQIKGQKAQAAWAPYQDEFKSLTEQYKAATASGNNALALEAGRRLMLIREKAHFSPFAGLMPAFGLAYVGIGAFLGMGRLAAYQKEVVAMGGTGPLANPEGFLWTGWLTDFTTFDPALWVLLSALTWLNVRRGALDAPKYSVWMARMPHLITPVFAIISLLVRFSAAQMLVGAASIGYTVAQSYALRVPTIRRMAGMQGVKNQENTLVFPGFRESWKEAIDDGRKWNEGFVRDRMESSFPRGPIRTHSGTEIPAPQINRNALRIKEAPPSAPKLLANPSTPDAPPPPAGMLAAMKNEVTSVVQARGPQSTARGAAQSNAPKTKVPVFKFPPTLQKAKAKRKVTAKKGK